MQNTFMHAYATFTLASKCGTSASITMCDVENNTAPGEDGDDDEDDEDVVDEGNVVGERVALEKPIASL